MQAETVANGTCAGFMIALLMPCSLLQARDGHQGRLLAGKCSQPLMTIRPLCAAHGTTLCCHVASAHPVKHTVCACCHGQVRHAVLLPHSSIPCGRPRAHGCHTATPLAAGRGHTAATQQRPLRQAEGTWLPHSNAPCGRPRAHGCHTATPLAAGRGHMAVTQQHSVR